MTTKSGPITEAWNWILDHAPSEQERIFVDGGYRALFFGGAIALWDAYCKIDDPIELQEFIEALEADFKQHHERARSAIAN